MKKLPLVKITWLDSLRFTEKVWWNIDEVMEENKDEFFTSVGYLIEKGKKHTIIANSVHHYTDSSGDRVGDVFSIPTGCITKIQYL